MKRSVRDESIRVVIHMCMEAMLGISLYSYSYCLCLLFNKIGEEEEQVLPGSKEGGVERTGMGGMGENGPMYAHMNK
jgi:hypothetical protein